MNRTLWQGSHLPVASETTMNVDDVTVALQPQMSDPSLCVPDDLSSKHELEMERRRVIDRQKVRRKKLTSWITTSNDYEDCDQTHEKETQNSESANLITANKSE